MQYMIYIFVHEFSNVMNLTNVDIQICRANLVLLERFLNAGDTAHQGTVGTAFVC